MKTIEDFQKAVKEKNINFWNIHDCSICNYKCGFIFFEGNIEYDSGCHCVTYCPAINPRTWEDVLNQYFIQKNPELIKKYNEFWGFTE